MVGGRRKKHFCRKRMSRASLMSSYMKLDCASKILKRVISGKKRKRRRAREEEGRIWRDGGAGESANIPGGEWTLEMPGWPQPTLWCHGGRGGRGRDQTTGWRTSTRGNPKPNPPCIVTDSPRLRQVVHLIFPSYRRILTGPSQCAKLFTYLTWSETQTF